MKQRAIDRNREGEREKPQIPRDWLPSQYLSHERSHSLIHRDGLICSSTSPLEAAGYRVISQIKAHCSGATVLQWGPRDTRCKRFNETVCLILRTEPTFPAPLNSTPQTPEHQTTETRRPVVDMTEMDPKRHVGGHPVLAGLVCMRFTGSGNFNKSNFSTSNKRWSKTATPEAVFKKFS